MSAPLYEAPPVSGASSDRVAGSYRSTVPAAVVMSSNPWASSYTRSRRVGTGMSDTGPLMTVTGGVVPSMLYGTIAEAVSVRLPAVFQVTVNVWLPASATVNVYGAGSTAAGSVLENVKPPVNVGTTLPAGSVTVRVNVVGVPAERNVETFDSTTRVGTPFDAGRSNRRTPVGVTRNTFDPSPLTVMVPAPMPPDRPTFSPTGIWYSTRQVLVSIAASWSVVELTA